MVFPNTIQQIPGHSDITDVTGGFVNLKKEERIIVAFVPFIMRKQIFQDSNFQPIAQAGAYAIFNSYNRKKLYDFTLTFKLN